MKKIQDIKSLQNARKQLQSDTKASGEVLMKKIDYLRENTMSVIWHHISPFNDGQTKGIEGALKFVNKNVFENVLGLSDKHHGDHKHRHSNQILVKLLDYFLVKYSVKGAGRLLGALLGKR